ncbi:protein SIS2 [Cucumis melo var. makuwa]|uniref:Protein SIS2 n=1 Tax=Cucumis melo var. makuwa TaxID=1194695 RepID=A0A5D3BGL2_CUCMM|nr:protein SIS2 [Cucumis melo var. makuwa]TYJ98224.1 protein SIS2 [Cucumis melo var. makuwa]
MARFLISTRPFPFSSLPLAPPRAFFRPFTFSPPVRFSAHPSPSRTLRVVKTRAGASTSSYIFAFSIPLSLILITVLTALKIGDNLDKKFLEEVTSIHLISLHFVCGTGFWIETLLPRCIQASSARTDFTSLSMGQLALNQAIMEEDEDYEKDGTEISFEEKPTLPRTRNRPKREAEV